jgi:hypothetical protein
LKGSQLAVKLALTPRGAAIDRFCVRHLGHSPVSWIFARSEGVAYNRPLLLVTVGRRSGKERAVVLPPFRAGAGRVQVMIMLIVGGAGTLTGPIFGAAIIRLFPNLVSSYTDRWETLLGILFILFVLFAPKGIFGLLRTLQKRRSV